MISGMGFSYLASIFIAFFLLLDFGIVQHPNRARMLWHHLLFEWDRFFSFFLFFHFFTFFIFFSNFQFHPSSIFSLFFSNFLMFFLFFLIRFLSFLSFFLNYPFIFFCFSFHSFLIFFSLYFFFLSYWADTLMSCLSVAKSIELYEGQVRAMILIELKKGKILMKVAWKIRNLGILLAWKVLKKYQINSLLFIELGLNTLYLLVFIWN